MVDRWDPNQYERFKQERELPFWDLLAMVQPGGIERAVDLGCGTGRLTRELHRRLEIANTLGIDSSASMLEDCRSFEEPGLAFERADIAEYEPDTKLDLLFSNAALHWLDDHRALFARLAEWIAPGGQLAVQVPANFDHISHRLAAEVAREEPFAQAIGTWKRGTPILSPEDYASLLFELGFEEPRVELKVYPHVLASFEDLLEWQKGTLLTIYRERLGEELYERFVARFHDRLKAELGDARPLFYPFKRILMSARHPSAEGEIPRSAHL